jgi:hypothetical protein
MSWISEPDANATSPFARARVPAPSLIDKLLREVEADPSVVVDSGTVEAYCRRLVEAARLLENAPLISHPIDRVESFHYLLLMTAYAVESSVLSHDPREPMWTAPPQYHLLDWGAASPDGVYRRAMVRDDLTYRVWGRVGNAKYFSMDFRESNPMVTLMRPELDLDDDGNFAFFLGGEPRDRCWFPMHPGTSGITTREFFDDWIGAERSRLRIECLDREPAPRPEYDPARVAAEFDVLSDWILEGGVRHWMKKSTELEREAPNAFFPLLGRADTQLPVVSSGIWKLAPDEALVVELPDPEATFWAYQLASSLWHTLDYANRTTSLNQAQLEPDADGLYRVVVSARDPGVRNWLDTMGLRRGILILRFCGAKRATVPTTRRVRVTDVLAELPGTPRCTAGERRAQIAERREGVAHMVCD